MGCFHKWLRSRLQSGLTRAELALWHERLSSTSRDLASLLLLGEGVGIMLDAKMLLLFLPGILVPSAEQKQSGRTHWLRSHLGAALGSSSTVQAVSSEPSLQSQGLPSQKNSCQGAILTFDSRFRLSTLDFDFRLYDCLRYIRHLISRYLHQFAYVFHFLSSCI